MECVEPFLQTNATEKSQKKRVEVTQENAHWCDLNTRWWKERKSKGCVKGIFKKLQGAYKPITKNRAKYMFSCVCVCVHTSLSMQVCLYVSVCMCVCTWYHFAHNGVKKPLIRISYFLDPGHQTWLSSLVVNAVYILNTLAGPRAKNYESRIYQIKSQNQKL